MKGFKVLSEALERPLNVMYADEAIDLAIQLALKFKEKCNVVLDLEDRSVIIALINGDKIDDYQLKPKEKTLKSIKPERE